LIKPLFFFGSPAAFDIWLSVLGTEFM